MVGRMSKRGNRKLGRRALSRVAECVASCVYESVRIFLGCYIFHSNIQSLSADFPDFLFEISGFWRSAVF